MRGLLLTVVWALAAAAPAHGQVIFNANFNSRPLGPLTTGSPPDLPQVIITDDPGATVNVVTSAGNLTDKPVRLHSAPGSLAAVAFDNPSQLSSGTWRVSWDSLVLTTPADDPLEQTEVTITADSGGSLPTIWGIKYLPGGQFSVQDAGGFHSVGSFAVGSSSHFDLDLLLDSGMYQLSVNGGTLIGGALAENGQFLRTVFHSNGRTGIQLPDFAFDNLVVEAVPEPNSLVLVAVALAPMWAARRRRRQRVVPGGLRAQR